MTLNMQTEKSLSISQNSENLFRDRYGILALAAQATLTKTRISSKKSNYLEFKCLQWTRKLWQWDGIRFSDWIWIEPDTHVYQTTSQEQAQKERKQHD